MPGSSLWLTPPQPSEFNKAAQTLISSSIPQLFPSVKTYNFIPHVTLTSSIDVSSTYKEEPQKWLDSLSLSTEPVKGNISVGLVAIEPGEPFVKKLSLKASKIDALVELAAACRSHAVEHGDVGRARDWAKAEYLPHLSLMYADIEAKEVADRYAAIETACRKALDPLVNGESLLCTGGRIVLVDTTKPIEEWNVIAARNISTIRWIWNPQTQ